MVFENVFIYITLSCSDNSNMVSSGFLETENSDSKSSSIIYRPYRPAHLIYSCFFDADAVIPEGKLLYANDLK